MISNIWNKALKAFGIKRYFVNFKVYKGLSGIPTCYQFEVHARSRNEAASKGVDILHKYNTTYDFETTNVQEVK